MTTSTITLGNRVPIRNAQLDILRALAILSIVLAHSGAPKWLMELRSFDVPLLVIVSGMAFALSSSACLTYGKYLRSRVVRLVLPVWVFLTVFFLACYVLCKTTDAPFPYSFSAILESYCLGSGIGYIWIVRVFVLVAILAPLLQAFNTKCRSDLLYVGVLLGTYILYEISVEFYEWSRVSWRIADDYLFYAIPYGCLFGVGLRLHTIRTWQLFSGAAIILAVLLCCLAAAGTTWSSFTLIDYKYPPRQYYMWYGIAMSLLVFGLSSRLAIERLRMPILTFVSSSTLWIYLWHILVLRIWNWYPSIRPSFFGAFWEKWLVLLAVPMIITFVQKISIRSLLDRFEMGSGPTYLLSMAFLK